MSSDNLNVMDLSWDLIGNNNRQSNNIGNPTAESKIKAKETNGVKNTTSTRVPVTAPQQGKPPKTSIQKLSYPTKSTTPSTKPTTGTQHASSIMTPTPASQTASSSK